MNEVLQQILDLSRSTDYDFRITACPADPCQHLFEEWVPYYRMKWAIAKWLRPRQILEIGVRYGYSAFAFLAASPDSIYIGYDADDDTFGGSKGAIEWARSVARREGYSAEFIVGNTQSLDRFPNGLYDLIHVDGQQDELGYLHDLDLAASQGRYIVADGFFWTRDNFLAASEFLLRNKDRIEYYGVLPGYAGDLLIKVKAGAQPANTGGRSSDALRHTYTSDYYLSDCGGFSSFKRTKGAYLEDARLRAVTDIALLAPVGRALDIGCGRGEVALALARQGFTVTAVDYSASAIAIAREAVTSDADGGRVQLHCGDINTAPLSGPYSTAVAADVVEHMSNEELDALYARVAAALSADGLFVVHTYPNVWLYRYEYARRRRIARSVGAYLPAEPRSRYERLMHINEQSPRVLRRQLKKHFSHVLLWFTDHDLQAPVEALERCLTIGEMRSAADLFAVAAHRSIDAAQIVSELRMDDLGPLSTSDLQLHLSDVPSTLALRERASAVLTIRNLSAYDLKSWPPHSIHASYHWMDAETGECVIFDGERTILSPKLRAGSTAKYPLYFETPAKPGRYLLRATLVQEGVRWFDIAAPFVFADAAVDIVVRRYGPEPASAPASHI